LYILTLLKEGIIILAGNSTSYEAVESLGPVINELLIHPEQNLDMGKHLPEILPGFCLLIYPFKNRPGFPSRFSMYHVRAYFLFL
jgi:hypothetical protein